MLETSDLKAKVPPSGITSWSIFDGLQKLSEVTPNEKIARVDLTVYLIKKEGRIVVTKIISRYRGSHTELP